MAHKSISKLPFDNSTIKKNTAGSLIINASIVNNVQAIQISPAGNGKFGLTFRSVIDKTPEIFKYELKGKLSISYQHPFLETIHYEGFLLDIGIDDQEGVCTASFFFDVQLRQEPASKLIKL